MKYKDSLANTNPELAKEWHPTKNGKVTPQSITAGCDKKVWWYLPYDDPITGKHFDFEWQAIVKHRANGARCPIFCGKMVWQGYNDLASTNPELIKEWHPTKNGEITPKSITAGSDKKVWWHLPYDDPITGKHFDFEWQATVLSRVKGSGCPFVSGRDIWLGFNDLATVNPELIKEWHPTKNGEITPQSITAGSDKKVWWLLPYDDPKTGKHFEFEWEDTINHRNQGVGCPFVSGKAVWPGFNDLATVNPGLAKEWHPTKNGELLPTEVTAFSVKQVWWYLPYDDPITGKHFDFEWKAAISSRSGGNGCPFVSGKAVWPGFNDLATVNPELAKEWHPTKNGDLTPSDVTVKSGKTIWWYRPYNDPETGKHFNFEWQSTVISRAEGMGCPYLSGQRIWKGFNDLATVNPELAKEWHPTKNRNLNPSEISLFSTKKVWWYLPYDDPETGKHFDFEWQSTIANRASGNGCPYITGKAVWQGFNDLATTHPAIANEWHAVKNGSLMPTDITKGSNKKVWWMCSNNHSYQASPLSRVRGTSCPICSSERRTSFPEYAIYYYIKQIDDTVKHSYNDYGFELDVYLPKKKIGIEYDGLFWHKNKKKQDVEKNKKCKELGIRIFRFRENNLFKLDDYSIDINVTERDFSRKLQELILEVYGVVQNVNVERDYDEINALRTYYEKTESLLHVNPKLAEEWHPIKNGNLTPASVNAHSMKKVWWYLPYDDPVTGKHFDFEWQACVADRNSGNGCPYISNKAAWKGYNDLTTTYPELAKEWHPTKNGELKPYDVTSGSEKKVWWILPYDDPETGKHYDFEWQSMVISRTNGIGCPYLSGHAVWKGFNDLETVRPDLAKEWHPTRNGGITPSQITASSGKKVWWFLPYDDPKTGRHFDFEWQATVASRNDGAMCPYISQRAVWRGFNDLASCNPGLAKEWHPTKNGELTPYNISVGSSKKVWWYLPYDDPKTGKHFNFEWIDTVNNRNHGVGCPFLSGQRIWAGFNDLATVNPELAKEWHPTKNGELTPYNISAGSSKEVWWYLPYDDPKTGRHFDFEWKATIAGRSSGNKCPFVSGRAVWQGFNDLASNNPELAKEWHPNKNMGLTPQMVTKGSNKKVWWQCGNGHEWKATINNRTNGSDCPYCHREKRKKK